MTTLHPMDKILQTLVPVVIVPKHGQHKRLEKDGHRYLVANDGLWLELCNPWLYLCYPVAQQSTVPMPYGTLSPFIEFKIDGSVANLFEIFLEQGISESPKETGAWITVCNGKFKYRRLEATYASTGRLDYLCPALDEGETLFMDLHTHGTGPAFFSGTDNADDATSVKAAVCVGNLKGNDPPQIKARLCVMGLFLDVDDLVGMFGDA